MDQITNSTLKEQIRQRNETEARMQESQIQIQLTREINNLTPRAKYEVKGWLIGGAVLALITGSAVNSSFALVVFAAAIGTWIYLNYRVKLYNENLDAVKARLQDDASNRIRQAYIQADERTQQEIAAYENDVKMYAKKVINKADGITPMVDHVVNMFQRMISHADAGSHMKFIEADFYFQVINTGIKYSYQSRYTNPQDDYNFNKARYRDLNSPAECEGLAQALAKLVISKMKTIYPPNSLNITLTHNDAQVTLHFKGANKNFVPARDIM